MTARSQDAPARRLPQAGGHWLLGQARGMIAAGHETLCRIGREAGGIAELRVLHRRFVAITDATLAREVLVGGHERFPRGHHHLSLGAMLGVGLLTTVGAQWRQRRRLLNPAFRSAALAPVATLTAEAAAAECLDWSSAAACGHAVGAAASARRLSQMVIARALFSRSLEPAVADELSALTGEGAVRIRRHNFALVKLPLWVPTPNHRRLAALRRRLDALIDSQGASGSGGIRDRLYALRDADTDAALAPEAVRDELKTLLAAGYETTAGTLGFALSLLARHPAVQERCRAEADAALGDRAPEIGDLPRLALIRAVVDETLRLYPAVHSLSRVAATDDRLGGYAIPRGRVLLISIWGIHRDPAHWPDADSFRPERFLPGATWPRFAYLPFAAGQHACIGAEFAQIELTIALACILQAWRFAPASAGPQPVRAGVTLVPADPVDLRLEPR